MATGGIHPVDLEDLFNPDEQRRFRRLCLPTTRDELTELADTVELHVEQVRAEAGPQTDVDSAEALGKTLCEVLQSGLAFDDDERSLLRGAVEYFILADDADSDLDDPVGFDDDIRVLNAVLDRIDLPEFKLSPLD